MKKRVISLILVAAMLATSMSACGKKAATTEADSDATYTLQITATSPNTWSPTDWENTDEGNIISYTSCYLYDFVMNDTKDGYEIIPEMASELPVDVTADFVGTYNIPADATEGYAWNVKLNEDACWEDGTPITAADYEYTLQQFLNPEMKNYRASSFYSGTAALANAQGYYGGGVLPVYDSTTGAYADVTDADMSVNVTDTCAFFGDGSIESYHDSYADYYVDADGNDIYEELVALGCDNTTALTDEIKALLVTLAANFGSDYEDAYKEFCTYVDADSAASWDQVGFIVNGDYDITFVFSNPVTYFNCCYGLTSLTLLNEDLYEANKQQTGDIVKSTYGTAVDKYASYGPYKITSFQEGKEMVLEKNENWWGYTDGNHEGQYQTTGITLNFVDEHTTQLSLFLQGKLDEVGLTSEDMDTYGSSDYIEFTPESYTYKYTFNSDIDMLKSEESAGINHSILSYDDFRHAIFVAVDRKDYVNSCTAAHEPGYGLINYIYVCDADTGELYRDSEYAQQALCNVYGVDSYDDITGYDPELATQLFQSAYEQCLADGNIAATDKIELDMHVYGSDSTYQKLIDFLQKAIDNTTVGTDLEGKITINLVEDQDYYSSLEKGIVDIAVTAWGGADMDPYSIMECYCSDTYKLEYGFQPTVETFTATIDGQEITHTYYDWFEELVEGTYATASTDVRNQILAAFEENFLLQYECCPLSYRTASALVSQRLVEGSDTYINSLVGFGGIRFLTWTMNDEEWAAYCAEQNNQLTY